MSNLQRHANLERQSWSEINSKFNAFCPLCLCYLAKANMRSSSIATEVNAVKWKEGIDSMYSNCQLDMTDLQESGQGLPEQLHMLPQPWILDQKALQWRADTFTVCHCGLALHFLRKKSRVCIILMIERALHFLCYNNRTFRNTCKFLWLRNDNAAS